MFCKSLPCAENYGITTVGLTTGSDPALKTNTQRSGSPRPGPTLPPNPAGTPPTRVPLERNRPEADDEVRPAAVRLPPRSFKTPRPLLRMDLQGQRQDRQRPAHRGSGAALQSRHETAAETQGYSGQIGTSVANRAGSPGKASRRHRLIWRRENGGDRLFSAIRHRPKVYPVCYLLLALISRAWLRSSMRNAG